MKRFLTCAAICLLAGAAQVAALTLKVTPPSAAVAIDGILYPATDGIIRAELTAGVHELAVTADGHRPFAGKIDADQAGELTIKLTPLTAEKSEPVATPSGPALAQLVRLQVDALELAVLKPQVQEPSNYGYEQQRWESGGRLTYGGVRIGAASPAQSQDYEQPRARANVLQELVQQVLVKRLNNPAFKKQWGYKLIQPATGPARDDLYSMNEELSIGMVGQERPNDLRKTARIFLATRAEVQAVSAGGSSFSSLDAARILESFLGRYSRTAREIGNLGGHRSTSIKLTVSVTGRLQSQQEILLTGSGQGTATCSVEQNTQVGGYQRSTKTLASLEKATNLAIDAFVKDLFSSASAQVVAKE